MALIDLMRVTIFAVPLVYIATRRLRGEAPTRFNISSFQTGTLVLGFLCGLAWSVMELLRPPTLVLLAFAIATVILLGAALIQIYLSEQVRPD